MSNRHNLTEDFLRQQYIELKRSMEDIASEVGVCRATIGNYLRRYNIPRRTSAQSRHKFIDSLGFEDLSTDWHAYWTGFLAADGCVFVEEKKNTTRLQLKLKISDADHIRNLQHGLKTSNAVREHKDYAILTVYDADLIKALSKWGIVPGKTLTMNWPSNLSPDMVLGYIRGYFDGDGTVYQRHRSAPGTTWTEAVCRFISGSVPFLEGLANELNNRGVQTLKIHRNQQSNAFYLPISARRENLLTFASLIYAGSTVCLERKRSIFSRNGGLS
jgi:hypothetical protein